MLAADPNWHPLDHFNEIAEMIEESVKDLRNVHDFPIAVLGVADRIKQQAGFLREAVADRKKVGVYVEPQ